MLAKALANKWESFAENGEKYYQVTFAQLAKPFELEQVLLTDVLQNRVQKSFDIKLKTKFP